MLRYYYFSRFCVIQNFTLPTFLHALVRIHPLIESLSQRLKTWNEGGGKYEAFFEKWSANKANGKQTKTVLLGSTTCAPSSTTTTAETKTTTTTTVQATTTTTIS